MRTLRWVGCCVGLCATQAHADDVDLFPKQALGAAVAPADAHVALPLDAPWRAAVRGIDAAFRPAASAVSRQDPIRILARQLARRREGRPTPPNRSTDYGLDITTDVVQRQLLVEQQVTAAQEAFEEPAVWERVEIEAVVREAGAPVRVRLVKGSGRAALDERAMHAVRSVLGSAHDLAERGPVVVKVVVEAGVSVAMPARVLPAPTARANPAGVLVPVARGRFGDGKKTEVTFPVEPRVRTRVHVESITR